LTLFETLLAEDRNSDVSLVISVGLPIPGMPVIKMYHFSAEIVFQKVVYNEIFNSQQNVANQLVKFRFCQHKN